MAGTELPDAHESLLAALALVDTGARTSEDIFTAGNQWMSHGRVFGGQVLAQTVLAAYRTVPADRHIHSLHGYFLRPGDVSEPTTLAVDRIHDGRSFTARRTQAYQKGVPIFSGIASFQDSDPGLDHQSVMPSGLPAPETLPSAGDLLRGYPAAAAALWTENAFDFRHIQGPVFLDVPEPAAKQAVWIRCRRRLPDDPVLHRAIFAYVSDYTLLESVLRRHGVAWATPGLKIASLDHAMWWHRPGRADEWFCYVQESPNAIGGRGLAAGRMYAADGTLIASVAQEGMIRVPAGTTPAVR